MSHPPPNLKIFRTQQDPPLLDLWRGVYLCPGAQQWFTLGRRAERESSHTTMFGCTLGYMPSDELSYLLGEAERRQLHLVYAGSIETQARRDRDAAVRNALAKGASVSEMARLVGITRQSIMKIRDVDLTPDYNDGYEVPLEEEMSHFYDGKPYGSDQGDERA